MYFKLIYVGVQVGNRRVFSGTVHRASDFPRSRKSRGIADLKRNP